MALDKRYLQHFDYISFLIMLILCCFGLLFVFSSTYTIENPFSIYFKKQLFGIITGIFIYFLLCIFDYRSLEKYGFFLYFFSIFLLVLTLIKGNIGMGAKRWINLGFIKFQSSELVKLFFPSFFSYYLYTEDKNPPFSLKVYFPIIAILIITVFLILKQPDLGTGLIILFSGVILFWLLGVDKKYFLWSFILCGLAAPLLYKCLKPYQRKRIEVFFGAGNSKDERYQIEQSKIAIGSGGITGKGFLKGTQNKYLFLPESRTDFIFAVICEELGFIGALIVILLFALLFIRTFFVISSISNLFAQIFAIGLIIPIILSTIINISMVIGLLPIVGIPLPFISYGISHIWITFAILGCYNSIATRRFYLSLQSLNLRKE